MKLITDPIDFIYGISPCPEPEGVCVALASAILSDSQSPTLCALVISGVPNVKNGERSATRSPKLDNHNTDGAWPLPIASVG